MGRIYTSRYSNRDLQYADVQKVGVSQSTPRFPLKYKLDGNIAELAPGRSIFRMTDKVAFRRKYLDQLDRLGKGRVVELLVRAGWVPAGGKDIVLLCYEDVTSPDETKNWCHRTYLAEWIEKNVLGSKVEEYPDSWCYAAKNKKKDQARDEDEYEQFKFLF